MTHTNGIYKSLESLPENFDTFTKRYSADIQQVKAQTKNLDQLPLIAQTLKELTRNCLYRDLFIAIVIIIILTKGSNLHIKTAWFEISGNESPK